MLIRDVAAGPEVLLGRRHAAAAFMPGVYVAPGGRLEPADRRPSGFPETLRRQPEGLDSTTRRRLTALARCAFREAFEEAGVLVGCPGRSPRFPSGVWQAYAAAGLAPAFGALRLVARAITPAGEPMRFHGRFFLASGESVVEQAAIDGELENVGWVPLAEAEDLPMAEVTALVLREALAHHRARARATQQPAARFAWRRGRRLPARRA